MKKIALHASMGEQVLRHLSQFGELPERGVVAGQAVASAVDDLYGRGTGVYNDVDVFRLVGANPLTNSSKATDTARLTTSGPFTTGRYVALEQFLAEMRTYRVSSVSEKGMLNYVNCVLPVSLGRTLTPGRVIQSFDLNCVRVAVDLETKQLSWDRHFERFIHTRQLEIVAVHTPWHTFLRLLKKLEELPGAYADIAASAEAAAAVSQSQFYQEFLNYGTITRTFGTKAKRVAEAHRRQWEPYFALEECSILKNGKEVALYSMTPRGKVDSAVMQRVDKLRGAALHYSAEAVYQSRLKKSPNAGLKLQGVAKSLPKFSIVHEYIKLQGSRYVEGNVSDRHVDALSNFLRDHYGFRNRFSDMTLDEQYRKIKELKALEKEKGAWIYGVLESQATAIDLANEASIRQLLDSYQRENIKPIQVEPLRLPKLPACWRQLDVVVEELLTPLEMAAEGEAMGHCVGGYASEVRDNRCRIVRIRTSPRKADWSTVEVRAKGKGKLGAKCRLQVQQHRARYNGTPSELNEQIVRFLVQMHGASLLEQAAIRTGLSQTVGQYLRRMSATLASVVTWMNEVADSLGDIPKLSSPRHRNDGVDLDADIEF